MLRKSPASDAWAAILKNVWALQKLQNWAYFNIFFLIYGCFLSSLLMVVPSFVSLKPIKQLRKIKTKKLRKKVRKSQPNF